MNLQHAKVEEWKLEKERRALDPAKVKRHEDVATRDQDAAKANLRHTVHGCPSRKGQPLPCCSPELLEAQSSDIPRTCPARPTRWRICAAALIVIGCRVNPGLGEM